MNRRLFLSSAAAIAATISLDPEKLLWRPGAKLISIPKPQPVHVGVDLAIAPDATVWTMYHARRDGLYASHNGGPWQLISFKVRSLGISTLVQDEINKNLMHGNVIAECEFGFTGFRKDKIND